MPDFASELVPHVVRALCRVMAEVAAGTANVHSVLVERNAQLRVSAQAMMTNHEGTEDADFVLRESFKYMVPPVT